jgi:Domain of unknown function (DUF4185)
MRVETCHVFALALALSGCAVNIGSESERSAAPAPTAPTLNTCLPLADRASTLNGRVSLVTLPDQSSLVVADSATVAGVTSSVGFTNANADCWAQSTALPAQPIVNGGPLGAGIVPRPLASVTSAAQSDAFLYFSADHADGLASDGYGVANWDANSRSFVALSILWTSDRPSYGSAAALVGDEVYVLGGLNARFLSADVYLARVPSAQIAEPSAYEYWQGGGNYGSDPDSALPVVEGGASPSVAWNAAQQRFLMLYATPLANQITVRSGLGISGPWSAPYTLADCDLPASDPSSFCGDLALVPELAADGEIAFTQAVASFARPARATDQDFWTRLAHVPWPTELP